VEHSVKAGSQRAGLKLALLAFAQFIVTIDYNIVYVALPDIGKALGFSAQSLQWVVSAYAVGFGGLLLFGGRAVDRLGPRRMFMVALVLYAVSSLAGGLSGDPGLLVAARLVQGLGGALLFPATLTLIFISFTEGAQRNRAMGVWGAAGGAGLSAGALLGGILTSGLGWEWVFFVNVPLALIAAFAARVLLTPDAPRTSGKRFDIPGAVLATAGATLVVFGLVSGPEAGWWSVRAAGAIILGVVLSALFVAVEARTRDALVPLRLFRVNSLVITIFLMIIYQATLGGEYYIFTTYLQDVLGFSPLAAGLGFLPLTLISMAASSRVAARLMGRLGTRNTLVTGFIITGVGMGALALAMSATGSYWSLLPGVIIWGVGGGIAFPTLFVSASAGVAAVEQGVAAALASTFRQIGGAIGLAALVAVVTVTAGLSGSAASAAASPDLVGGLRTAGLVAGVATIVGAVIALLLKKPAPPAAAAATTPAAGAAEEEGIGVEA
jgi:EmrB/QacA subfamily drug resistance transporter